MKLLFVFFATSLSAAPLLADISAAFPPSPYDTSSITTTAFSDANAEAIYFLSIMDNQQYAGAWLQGGGLMRDITPKEQWIGGMRATRMPLGSARTRALAGYVSHDVLPGGTRGEFMTIKYNTQFSQNATAVESVVLMRSGPLGLWKVVTYSIGRK